ncbi:hypothetical protein CEXT_571451 [Caerostris extrusa]|uniref:Uncharacterized protein n=1 Tax=Caerostris extrusa TaxID=172846 RepID=A0AAV4R528_CAEEX|nr:hypothetical protein CEXT_571451 [Caerostris extrusa]
MACKTSEDIMNYIRRGLYRMSGRLYRSLRFYGHTISIFFGARRTTCFRGRTRNQIALNTHFHAALTPPRVTPEHVLSGVLVERHDG